MTEKASSPRHHTYARWLLGALTTIALALSYFCVGYLICADIPLTTRMLAEAHVDDTCSPFDKEDLVEGALATRDYSFGSHDKNAYYETIASLNQEAKTPYADASFDALREAPEQYTITSDALSHLDDVSHVADAASVFSLVVITIALVCCILCVRIRKRYFIARPLIGSGVLILGILIFFGIWAAVSFESLFSAFHSLLFANGTWTFSADSLLITMLPEGFWIGMATVWLFTSALLAMLSLAIGIVLTFKRNRRD